MQFKATVVRIDHGILRNIGVVDHAVLAVCNKGMDFHIVVGGEPLVQDLFTVGSPQDGTVQDTAVFEGVRQTGDVNAAAVAEAVCSHLYFLVLLNQDVSTFVSKDALLAFSEVHFVCHIGQDEVVGILDPIVLIVVQREAGFLLNAQNICQLQVVALVLVAGRLTDTDEAAAIMNELTNSSGNGGIFPLYAASVSGIAITYVDDNIDFLYFYALSPGVRSRYRSLPPGYSTVAPCAGGFLFPPLAILGLYRPVGRLGTISLDKSSASV